MANGSYGSLVINVKTARGAIPVEGANVTVSHDTQSDNGESIREIISVLQTDRNGLTPTIRLATRARALSETPEYTEQPYLTYIIETSKEGFYSVENINTPIFEGITSVQPVLLIPLSYISDGAAPNIIYNESIPPQL